MMSIKNKKKKRSMSLYKLSLVSEIPYSTLYDIFNEKTDLKSCSAETVYKLSHALGMTVDMLLSPVMIKRSDFELYKSNVCHKLKELGDRKFILETIRDNEIRMCYIWGWYPECFYLLAMLDYICRINNIPMFDEYDDIRQYKLEETIYPAGLRVFAVATKDESVLDEAYKTAIPEFVRFNIVENEVRNVV